MPGITVYASSQLERLATVLAHVLRLEGATLGPFEPQQVVVPTQGLARWVQQTLAQAHGVSAGLRTPFVGNVLDELLADRAAPDQQPFAKDALVLRLFRLLGAAEHQARLGAAAAYCADDPTGLQRFQLATRLASTFDDYQLLRPDLLRRAARGDDLHELGSHGPWQAELWRLLLGDADATTDGVRLDDLARRLDAAEPTAAQLPRHLHLFGIASLPPAYLAMLQRLARTTRICLYAPLPTVQIPALLAGGAEPAGGESAGNPLLSRFGQTSREFAVQLAEQDGAGLALTLLDDPIDPQVPTGSLLQRLQQDVRAVVDRSRGDLPRHVVAADDTSLLVHDCHAPMRELEVVKDQILAAFAADPELEPHQVIVLVTDIATYAPYAEAVFGPVHKVLPYRVADRDPGDEQPLCSLVLTVLELAIGRLGWRDVLAVLQAPAVLRRFGCQASDVPVVQTWLERAGVRWGIDGDDRQRRHGLRPFDENSFRAGLRRLLLGVAVGRDPHLYGGVLAAADGTSGRIALLDRLLAFTDELFAQLGTLATPAPATEWADRLDNLRERLAEPGPEDQTGQRLLLDAAVALRTLAPAARLDEAWSNHVFTAWLRQRLAQTSGGHGFLTGAVTVAALQPMRMVPHELVFLCGLSDQNFPRRDTPLPFDLTQVARRPGDRSRRLDDRQVFLDALLAARRTLQITYVGRSLLDDSVCEAAPMLRETLEYVRRSCVRADGRDAAEQLVVRHALQPWSERYLDGRDPRLFTFAAVGAAPDAAEPAETPFAAALATARPTDDDADDDAGDDGADPAPPATERTFDELCAFWREPARRFLRDGLRLRLPRELELPGDDEPFAIERGLPQHRLFTPLLHTALLGHDDPLLAYRLHQAAGELPVGGGGNLAFHAVADAAVDLARRARELGELREVAVTVQVGAATLVADRVLLAGDVALLVRRRSNPRVELELWLLHLLLTAARDQGHTELPAETLLLTGKATLRLGARHEPDAQHRLAGLLRGYQLAAHQPIPFAPSASRKFVEAIGEGKDEVGARAAARAAYEYRQQPGKTTNPVPAEADAPANRLCWRGASPIDAEGFPAWAHCVWDGFAAAHFDAKQKGRS